MDPVVVHEPVGNPPPLPSGPRFSGKKIAFFLAAFLFVVGVPLTVLLSQQNQNGQSHASLSYQLLWPAPTLTSPITVVLGTGETTSNLDPTKDYIIQLPNSQKTGMTKIVGGHNIIIRGGYLTVAAGLPVCKTSNNCTDERHRALFIKDATGTVHIEGIQIDSASGSEADGIFINAPKAIVQVENVRMDNIKGSDNGYHAAMVRVNASSDMRLDHVTGSTTYNGFDFTDNSISSIEMQNVNATHLLDTGGKLLRMTGTDDCTNHPKNTTFSNVYFTARTGKTVADNEVLPSTQKPAGCRAKVSGTTITWPNAGWVKSGSVTDGVPTTDFVTTGLAGVNYVALAGQISQVPTTYVTLPFPIHFFPTDTPTPTPEGSDQTSPSPVTSSPSPSVDQSPSVTETQNPSPTVDQTGTGDNSGEDITDTPTDTPIDNGDNGGNDTGGDNGGDNTGTEPTSPPSDTNTGTPASATFALHVFLHGLGKAVNNAGTTGGNPNPKTPVRQVAMAVLDSNNIQVANATGTITYDSSTGSFIGTLTPTTLLSPGTYQVKIAVPNYPARQIDGLVHIQAGQQTVLPTLSLIAGDANHDNKLDILDFNVMRDCYEGDTEPHPGCAADPQKKASADLNDDGKVDSVDLNLFVEELSVYKGD